MDRPANTRSPILVGEVDEVSFEVVMKKTFSESTPSDEECEFLFLLIRKHVAEVLGETYGILGLDGDGGYRVIEQLSLLAEIDGEKR